MRGWCDEVLVCVQEIRNRFRKLFFAYSGAFYPPRYCSAIATSSLALLASGGMRRNDRSRGLASAVRMYWLSRREPRTGMMRGATSRISASCSHFGLVSLVLVMCIDKWSEKNERRCMTYSRVNVCEDHLQPC